MEMLCRELLFHVGSKIMSVSLWSATTRYRLRETKRERESWRNNKFSFSKIENLSRDHAVALTKGKEVPME